MSNLQDRLDEFKKVFESGAPPYNAPHEAIETIHRATAELKASDIEEHALKGRWSSASSEDTGDRTA